MDRKEEQSLLELLSSQDENYIIGKNLFKVYKLNLKTLLKAWGLKSLRQYNRKDKSIKTILTFDNSKFTIIKRFDKFEWRLSQKSFDESKTPRFEIHMMKTTSVENIITGKIDKKWSTHPHPNNLIIKSVNDILKYIKKMKL